MYTLNTELKHNCNIKRSFMVGFYVALLRANTVNGYMAIFTSLDRHTTFKSVAQRDVKLAYVKPNQKLNFLCFNSVFDYNGRVG